MKKLLSFVAAIFIAATTFAQVDEVTLVVNGSARTKDEAVSIALRSAIEQAFGTFVSANTNIVNDRLTKDEIVTLSSGNIKKYEELSSIEMPNKQFAVTLRAIVSVKKLTTFAKSHGSSCELAGNTFAQNMKLRELYKHNEEIAAQHLKEQLRILENNLFDISIETGQPYKAFNGYKVPITLTIKATENSDAYINSFFSTLESLKLSEQEKESYKETHDAYYDFYINVINPVKCSDIGQMVRTGKDEYQCVKEEEKYLGSFRSSKTYIFLNVYQQLVNLKICYKNDRTKYQRLPHNIIFTGLYEKDSYWSRNDDFFFSDERYMKILISQVKAYYNLYAYKRPVDYKQVFGGKIKKIPQPFRVITTITYNFFVPENDMSTLTGFEIVYD